MAATSGGDAGTGMTLLMGAAAGAVAVWALDRADWFMWNRMDEKTRERTRSVRPGGEPPAHVLASAAERAAGLDVSERQHKISGDLIHYSIGVAPAAAYAVFRDKLPIAGPARGALYGLGMFLLQDESLNSISGLGAKPSDYPWQDHARGLVAHVVYGITTELVLNALENAAGELRDYSS